MRTWDLWLCLGVYTITCFGFGLWVQKTSDTWQLRKIEANTWKEGCNRCAEFEKNACARDQLQGVKLEPEKIQ